MKVLRMYGIEDYINCITTDNASVNDAIFNELEFQLTSWFQREGQIRCLAHVLNLAAQTVFTTLKSEAREAEVVLEGCEESGSDERGPAATLSRLRRIIAKIRSSTTLWEALKTEVQAIKLAWLAPILDVRIRVRWNSTHKMIERAIELWPALEHLLSFDPSRAFQRAQLTLTRCQAHGFPVRIYRAKLPYLDACELRRRKITPPSSPGVGTARHHWPPG